MRAKDYLEDLPKQVTETHPLSGRIGAPCHPTLSLQVARLGVFGSYYNGFLNPSPSGRVVPSSSAEMFTFCHSMNL